MLRRLRTAVTARANDMAAAMAEEYGAPAAFTGFCVLHAAALFEDMATTVETYLFHRNIGRAEVSMEPLGVVAAIIPWNSTLGLCRQDKTKAQESVRIGSILERSHPMRRDQPVPWRQPRNTPVNQRRA